MKPFHVRNSQDQHQPTKLNLAAAAASNTITTTTTATTSTSATTTTITTTTTASASTANSNNSNNNISNNNNNKRSSATSNNAIDIRILQQQRQLFTIKELSDNYPTYILRDEPKPAVFLARKLFVDFGKLVADKVEQVLGQQESLRLERPLFRCFQRQDDAIYDQILEAIGAISEYCLPSMLAVLLDWYRRQLGDNQAASGDQQQPAAADCEPAGGGQLESARAASPTSPADSQQQQVAVTSTLSLEYQSASLTVLGSPGEQQSSSAANTSTSSATNVSSGSLEAAADTSGQLSSKRLELLATRRLLIEYAFCQALIEIFNQLHLHPGYEHLIGQVEAIAFEHFRYVEPAAAASPLDAAAGQLADKYAEVVGVLARTRFRRVRGRFMAELQEARAREPTAANLQAIVSLLQALRFFRVKMAPVEEFEASLQFLAECADYFLEVRHKSVKHALACLFVEIMTPLSVAVKNEVKIPCLKNLVELLWPQALEMCGRKKHALTFFPLVTCLLCLSQRAFFLTNWPIFLSMCLSNLKNRDQKLCRAALDSLYRLVWIYMVRIKCESNNITQARLHAIVDALFPRASRTVIPREAPLALFVDIIQFVALERLDFAMRHIIFELLAVERPSKLISAPERMNVALQAYLAIADNLQRKEGEPPAPKGLLAEQELEFGERANGKTLTDELAKSLGLGPYHAHVQRALADMLRALDVQCGKPLLLTAAHQHQNHKEPGELVSGERRPKVELLRTCVAALPRLLPEGLGRAELLELVWRLTVHVDVGLRRTAFESLRRLVVEEAEWRLDAIEAFTSFLASQLDESMRELVDGALGMLLELLLAWRQLLAAGGHHQSEPGRQVSIQTGYESISSRSGATGGQIAARRSRALAQMRLIQTELASTRFERLVAVLQKVEGAALVLLCQCQQPSRRLAGQLLRECRALVRCYASWICLDQFGLRSPDELDEQQDEQQQLDGLLLSGSLRGSLSADNLSRVTALSSGGPAHGSASSVSHAHPWPASASSSSTFLQLSASRASLEQQQQQQRRRRDLYDSDADSESPLADNLGAADDNNNSDLVFWFAVIMLESQQEREYTFALRLLARLLPELPLEQSQFVEELERTLDGMRWPNFPGLQALVLRGCHSPTNHELAVGLLDQLTPLLRLRLCIGQRQQEAAFPAHVMALLSYLLAHYEQPTKLSLSIARRLAAWCDDNSSSFGQLDNLSAVLQLYSRRSFSKDAFQWTKCVVKYLHDAFPKHLPLALPALVDLLELGPASERPLTGPILHCLLSYADLGALGGARVNELLGRVYANYLAISLASEPASARRGCWRDALQLFRLIVSRASQLVSNGHSMASQRSAPDGGLPGRTMDFSLDVSCMPLCAGEQPAEPTVAACEK